MGEDGNAGSLIATGLVRGVYCGTP